MARLDARLEAVPATELQLARLRRQVELMGQLYTLLQTRLKEAEIAEAAEIANIQVVDPAVAPTWPIRPRKAANLLFGLLAGLLLGLVVALARELADTVVRSRDEAVMLTDLPVLAAIPRHRLQDGGARDPVGSVEGRLVTRHSPRSPAAEAYRALRTNLAFSSLPRQRPLRTVVVTSAEPQAGKSTTAVNLATTFAEQGMKVLLLEADQRRPVLHRVLHVDRVPGLTDVLAGRASTEQARRRVSLPEHATGTLDFIAGGTTIPNPAEVAGSQVMRDLLTELASRYDAVVLDTPPLSLVTDAAVTGTVADGVIVVARMGATHRDALRHAVEELRSIGAPLVGMVLTDVHHTEDRYGQRYDRYYGEGE
jgi:capsular exopolysaccharide synthesis family protein